jgi:hypothetical protein
MAKEPKYADGAGGQFFCGTCKCVRYCDIALEITDDRRMQRTTCLWCKATQLDPDPLERLPKLPQR